MNFEESLKYLADSNEELAKSNLKIAEANEAVGNAMLEYSQMLRASISAATGTALEAVGGAAAPVATGGKKTPTAADKKAAAAAAAEAAKKTEAKPAVDDFGDPIVDSFGDEDALPDKLDADTVRAKLLEVRDVYGDKGPALKIIGDFGYNAIPEVKPEDYANVYKAAVKAIKAAPKK